MTIFDSIITNSIPHLPKWFAKPFSKPYVAGENVEEALSEIRHLNSKGFSATIDILGEHTEDTDIARNITHQYCNLYEQIENNGLCLTHNTFFHGAKNTLGFFLPSRILN